MRDPQFHDQRPNAFASVEIIILRGVNQIESGDPANYAGPQDKRCRSDVSRLRNPGANRSDGKRQAQKEVRCAREPFRE